MKKILGSMVAALIILSVAIPVSHAVVEASNGFAGGSGTAEDPYQITDWIQLDSVRDDLSAHFILMNNLDSATGGYGELAGSGANSGAGWLPIGTEGSPFSGSLDGQGFGIEEVHIDRADSEYVGLFGFIGGGAVVEAFGLTDCVVIGSFRTGGLVGASAGTVNECYATGSVNADDNDTGGLMGVNAYGTLTNCYATVSVNGLSRVGGLVGLNGGIMRNCYATGSVTGDTDVGGLVGDSLGGVSNSFWDTQTSGAASSDDGTGKTTAELMRLETFTDTDTDGLDEAWDMAAVGHGEIDPAAVWNIVDGRGYPFLNWERVRVEVQLELKTGWNMVSVPRGLPEGEDTVEKVFKGEIDAIYTWNPSSAGGGDYEELDDDDVLDWQRGYWIAVTEDKTLTLRI